MQKSLNESDFVAITRFAINRINDYIFWTDEQGNFLELNQSICDLLGYSRDELLTMNVGDMDPDFTQEMRRRMLERLKADLPYVVQTRPRSKDGSTTTIEFTVERFRIGDRVFFVTHGHEVDLAREHRKRVLESIAAGEPLSDTLATVITLAEETRMGMIGSILLLDGSGALRPAASSQLSTDYCEQIDGLIPGPEVGSCGTAAFFRKNVMVSDIANSSLWASVSGLAEKEGLKSCWSVPILSSTGKVLGTLAMYFREVTVATRNDEGVMESLALLASIAIERDEEHQRVRMSELRYRLLTQTTMDSVWTTSPTGEFVTRQISWEKYTGQPWEEHRGFGWSMMLHEDDRDRLKSNWAEALKENVSYFSHGRIWHAMSREYRHFEVFAVPVRAGEQVVEWIGCTTDVHDAKVAENSLRHNEWRMRTITDAMPSFVAYLDVDYRFKFVNEKIESWFKMPREDFVGTLIKDVIGEERFHYFKLHIDHAFEGEVVKFEQRDTNSEGRSFIFEVNIVPQYDKDDKVCGAHVLVNDITESRALEKEVMNVSALEKLRLGQDLHDGIGQELTGLGMISDTMLLAVGEDDAEGQFIARKIATGIRRTLAQVKMLARGLNPVDLSAGGIRSALVEMASHVEDLYGIRCVVACRLDIRLADHVMATNLFRIAQEATTNAAKHSGAKKISIYLSNNENLTTLVVADDGTGFKDPGGHGMGMRTMRYRAGIIGAKFTVSPSETGGTEILCLLSHSNVFPTAAMRENISSA